MAHDVDLILKICEGLQPPILPNVPDDYVQMMQKCWDADPSKRPAIWELGIFSENKLEEIYKGKIDFSKNNSNNSSDISSSSSNSDSPQQVHEKHPLAYH